MFAVPFVILLLCFFVVNDSSRAGGHLQLEPRNPRQTSTA